MLLNVPKIGSSLQGKPAYIEDLIITDEYGVADDSFKKTYVVVMNLILAVLLAASSEYVVIQGIANKPVIEIVGLVGGVLSLYVKMQNTSGRILLYIFHKVKKNEVTRRRKASLSMGV
jgi:hypothetical protein